MPIRHQNTQKFHLKLSTKKIFESVTMVGTFTII